METKTENSAVGNVTENHCKTYAPDNIIRYHAVIGMLEKLTNDGLLSACDYKKSCTIITERHGLSLDSIFAEIA